MPQIFITSNPENDRAVDVHYGEEFKGTFDTRYQRDEFRKLVDTLCVERAKELDRFYNFVSA